MASRRLPPCEACARTTGRKYCSNRCMWRERKRRQTDQLVATIGIEAARTIWRENSRKYVPLKGREHLRWTENTRSCSECGSTFHLHRSPNGQWSGSKTCSQACARARMSRQAHEWQERRRLAHQIGMACPVTYGSCAMCAEPFVRHTDNQLYCSGPCRKRHARDYMREYQRRTKATAIAYWRVAPTPEAEALARTYYELRQTLRTIRRRNNGTASDRRTRDSVLA